MPYTDFAGHERLSLKQFQRICEHEANDHPLRYDTSWDLILRSPRTRFLGVTFWRKKTDGKVG